MGLLPDGHRPHRLQKGTGMRPARSLTDPTDRQPAYQHAAMPFVLLPDYTPYFSLTDARCSLAFIV